MQEEIRELQTICSGVAIETHMVNIVSRSFPRLIRRASHEKLTYAVQDVLPFICLN